MRCPSLNDLPQPPPGRVGWPWTAESLRLSAMTQDGSAWPQVSIVTPSYNQGPFLEETIRSVLLQGYPNLEYVIIDGGSTDQSVDIIHKYEPWLTYWVSEGDSGQTEAINKGFTQCRGAILGWLNSDDTYMPQALARVTHFFKMYRDCAVVYGRCQAVDEDDNRIGEVPSEPFSLERLLDVNIMPQPTVFVRRVALNVTGGPDPNLHYAMDHEWWLRMAHSGFTFGYLPCVLANYRFADGSKSVSQPQG